MDIQKSKLQQHPEPKWRKIKKVVQTNSKPESFRSYTQHPSQNTLDSERFNHTFQTISFMNPSLQVKSLKLVQEKPERKRPKIHTDIFYSSNTFSLNDITANSEKQNKYNELLSSLTTASKSTREPTARSATFLNKDSPLPKSAFGLALRKTESSAKDLNSPDYFLKTDSGLFKGQSKLFTTEDYNMSIENTPYLFTSEGSKMQTLPSYEDFNFVHKSKIRPQTAKANKTFVKSPRVANIKSLVQLNYQKLEDSRVINFLSQTNNKIRKFSTGETSEKEIYDTLEGSIYRTEEDSNMKVKVYRRNKDTAFHLSKTKASTKTALPGSSSGLLPQTSNFNTTVNETQMVSFFSRPKTAQHRNRPQTAKEIIGSVKSIEVKKLRPGTAKVIPTIKDKKQNDEKIEDILAGSTLISVRINEPSSENKITNQIRKRREMKSKNKLSINMHGSSLPESFRDKSEGSFRQSSQDGKVEQSQKKDKQKLEEELMKKNKNNEGIKLKDLFGNVDITRGIKLDDLLQNLEASKERLTHDIQQKSIMNKTSTNNKDFFTFLPVETEQIHQEIERIIDNITTKLEAGKTVPEDKLELYPKNSVILDEYDMGILREEFSKKTKTINDCNYERIDAKIAGLKFFSKLEKSMRLELLKNGSLAYYPAGTTIFKQGDYGDLMYIIIRGAVNVRIMKQTIFGTIEDIIVAVLYDGSHFGEYAMMGTSQQNNKKKPTNNTNKLNGPQMIDIETGETKGTARTNNIAQPNLKSVNSTPRVMSENDLDIPKTENSPNFKERTKRTATIEVVESCDVVCIPRHHFQRVFLQYIQKELDSKIQILLDLPCFHRMDPYTLIPLANNLVSKVYKMGDVLIKAGQEVDRLMIVSQGRCKATMEIFREVENKPSTDLKGTISSLKVFAVASRDYSCADTNKREKKESNTLNGFVRPKKMDVVSAKSFDQEKIATNKDVTIYREHVPFHVLTKGDYFGGRGLICLEDINKYDDPLNKLSIVSTPANLSVIADSAVVEVFELDKEHLSYVPNFLAKMLLFGLKTTKEYDEYDIEKERKIIDEWNEFKKNEEKNILMTRTIANPAHYKKF